MSTGRTEHTQGKWIAHFPGLEIAKNSRDQRIMVLHPDGQRLIACLSTGFVNSTNSGSPNPIPEGERMANAHLIAAAPDLLSACRLLIESETSLTPTLHVAKDAIREAIAKAEGRRME